MKKKKTIAILTIILALSAPSVFAQEFVIPEPVCSDTPEIPCPGKGKSYANAQKPMDMPELSDDTELSKSFKDLMRLSGTYVEKILEWIKNGFLEMKTFIDRMF